MVISTEQLLSMDALDGWEDETQSKVSAFVLTSGMGEAGKLIAKTAAGIALDDDDCIIDMPIPRSTGKACCWNATLKLSWSMR